jgi:putative endopeptidase
MKCLFGLLSGFGVLLLVGVFVSCQSVPKTIEGERGLQTKSVVVRSELDESIRPGNDFFEYVNRKWDAAHPIPADQSSWGVGYLLEERVNMDLRAIAEELQTDGAASGDRQKIRDFYATAMDEKGIARDGVSPVGPEMEAIAGIKNSDDLARFIALAHLEGMQPLFTAYSSPDEKKSDRYSLHLFQGGTVLPEKSYYVDGDERSKEIRSEYLKHMTRMFKLLGDDETAALKYGQTVLGIETRLAEAQMNSVELRDVEKQYNPMTRAEAAKLTPSFNWDLYYEQLGTGQVKDVIVAQPAFMKRVEEMLKQTTMEDWRVYMRWHLIHSAAPCLSEAFVEEDFSFFGKVLNGAEKLKPRWKRVVSALDSEIGEALGRLYVEKHFSAKAKQRVNELVDNLMAAYAEHLRKLEWMTPATKEKALAKLHAIGRKLGYPDKWRDYSALTIGRDSYLRNAMRARQFESRRQLARVGGVVDREEWGMTPPTINAYYDPNMNQICFPAGILQAPYFDADADDALNYGGIGAIIGHEMTHGFDDQGCKFDGAGNMVDWWTAEDKAKFDERTKRVVQQFNQCVAVKDVHINGELTLGENIADLGGLVIAIDAYKRATKGKNVPEIDGFTGMQRFFVSYAISWRAYDRDEAMMNQLRVDPHSPAKFRVLVPLSNLPSFIDAFGVKPVDAMWRRPKDRAEVW